MPAIMRDVRRQGDGGKSALEELDGLQQRCLDLEASLFVDLQEHGATRGDQRRLRQYKLMRL
jgi:hypothetical protein